MGPQDQAKPAMKTQMHTRIPMEGGLGKLPWYFTNSYFRVTPTTISAMTIWITPAISRNLRPRRSTTTMATTVASTFTAGSRDNDERLKSWQGCWSVVVLYHVLLHRRNTLETDRTHDLHACLLHGDVVVSTMQARSKMTMNTHSKAKALLHACELCCGTC